MADLQAQQATWNPHETPKYDTNLMTVIPWQLHMFFNQPNQLQSYCKQGLLFTVILSLSLFLCVFLYLSLSLTTTFFLFLLCNDSS